MSAEKGRQTRQVIAGSVVIDTVATYPSDMRRHFSGFHNQVSSGHEKPFSVTLVVDKQVTLRGGTGANIAYSLALLGVPTTLLAAVGHTDTAYIQLLASQGIDVSSVHFSDTFPTATYSVVIDQQGSQIAFFNSGAMFNSESLSFSPFARHKVFATISCHDPKAMHRQISECVTGSIPFLFDFGQRVHDTSVETLLAGVQSAEIVIANEFEMDVLSRRTGIDLEKMKKQRPIVITTLGKDGAKIEGMAVTRPLAIPAAKTSKLVDPTGAGDAWRAGFLWAYSHALPLEIAGRCGAVCAAFCIEQPGGQTHHFTQPQFLQRYAENFGHSEELTTTV